MGNRSLIASLVTLALGLAPAASQAAGLGRLNVLSTIGQPLVGEIELVSVSRDELSTLSARIAPVEAFQSASIQYNPALLNARLSVERRPDGRPYLRLSSVRSVEEPFIDLLIELTWSTGRLVREYTALIDPPGAAPQPAAAAPVVTAPAAPSAPSAGAPVAPTPAARPQAQQTTAGDPGPNSYGPVQPGDTLRKIAAGVRPQGVSLDQVLVGIFRSNPDAFINNNMNLLRTGKILKIPEASELGQVNTADAGNEVRTQSADWNAYRQRVAAAAPAAAPAGESRAAAGKITTRVEEPGAAKDAPKEVLKISKGEPGKEGVVDKALQERVRVLEEEVTAREKSLKDASERIVSLEKTIKDMQRLLELKGAAPTPAPSDKADAAKAPADTAKAEPAPSVKPAPEQVSPPPVVTAKPAPKPITPEPAPQAAEWWEDPTILASGLLGLGALAGAGYILARRRREPAEVLADEPVIRRVPSVAAPAAAAAGGAAAGAALGMTTTQLPAQPSRAPVTSDDVDPIAEADVYIAYGRDAQAEEILKEALTKNPNRQEVKLKLLEIYAARKSKSEFNAVASDLHASTGGQGDVWLRAAAMGFALDSDNALYAAGKDSANLAPIGVQTDVNLDFDLDMVSAAGSPSTVTDLPLESGQPHGHEVKTTILSPETMSQLRAEGAAQAGEATQPTGTLAGPQTDVNLNVPPATSSTSNVIDFEFDPTRTANLEVPTTATFDPDKTMVISPENQEKAQNFDIEIDLSSLDTKVPADATTEISAPPATDISFDFNVPSVEAPPTVAGVVPPTDVKLDVPEFKPADTATMDFALDTVSFDLGSQSRETPAAPAHDERWYDVQTKFDLAKAYQEMGDKEGAREILAEVIKEGDAQQQEEAKALLGKIE